MKIRLARDGDYAAVARLHRQTIRSINSKDYTSNQIKVWSARNTAQRFRRKANKCKRWVALQGDKIIGYCDHGLNGEFWGLYVHRDYIGQGIGLRLLKKAEGSLKKCGYKVVELKSSITAKNFYKKHGYKVVKKGFHQIKKIKLPIYIMTKKIS